MSPISHSHMDREAGVENRQVGSQRSFLLTRGSNSKQQATWDNYGRWTDYSLMVYDDVYIVARHLCLGRKNPASTLDYLHVVIRRNITIWNKNMNVVPVHQFQWLSKTHNFWESTNGEISQLESGSGHVGVFMWPTNIGLSVSIPTVQRTLTNS